jgi:ketosteroid isomerase-like protein
MTESVSSIAKAAFEAYAMNDRAAIEALIADDLRFTSPLDNGVDRATYFARCWPNHEKLAKFEFVRVVESGAEALVTYECETVDGRRFRNTEVLTIRNGVIHAVEVYFGWSLPHPAAPGGFVEEPRL